MVTYRQLATTEHDSELAHTSKQLLARYANDDQPLTVHINDAEQDVPIELPASAVNLLLDILGAMAAGQGIAIVPEDAELTTAQAADLLNVSRPYLIKLLDIERIPYGKVGKHRRIRTEDIIWRIVTPSARSVSLES